MKIVIAPDSFKGSLTAAQAADAMENGIKRVFDHVEIVKVPMADGGEGTVQTLVEGTDGRIIKTRVLDPLGREIEAYYGILGDGRTAVIEMAAASGLTLVEKELRNPMLTSTFGTGQLITHALDSGCRSIILGIGGSATNDGGVGMAAALGVRFLNAEGKEITPCGGTLGELVKIDMDGLDHRLSEASVTVACDVDNPLVGPNGAACVYGPQKGADQTMVTQLDRNLKIYGDVLEKTFHRSLVDRKGAGAAGGLGVAAMAFFNATLDRGVDIVINVTNLKQKLQGAQLVITGEGCIDGQTRFGKTPFGVAQAAKEIGVPVIGIGGSLGAGFEQLYEHGFDVILSIVDRPMSLEDAILNAKLLVADTTERIMRIYKISMKK